MAFLEGKRKKTLGGNPMNKLPRRLITGHNGFVGSHALSKWPFSLTLSKSISEKSIDICDYPSLERYLIENPVEEVLHLAGISFIPDSFENPKLTYEVNFIGTLNLLEALKNSGFKGKFLFVSSGDVYGLVDKDSCPITEDHPVRPRNPYAVSKVAAENLCYQWSLKSSFEILIARPFNHIGAGQSEKFVISNFAKQIVNINSKKCSDILSVGNIDVTRDFTDVHDILDAYDALFKFGQNGETYNVCSGKSYSIRDLLKELLRNSNKKIEVVSDRSRWRPAEQIFVSASNKKISHQTGWSPQIPIEKTLLSTYQFWENQIV